MKVYLAVAIFGNSLNTCKAFSTEKSAFDFAKSFADENNLPFVAGMFWNDGDDSVEVMQVEVEEVLK